MDNIENIPNSNTDDVVEAPVRKRGTVNNFGFLNENGLSFIKEDLGLSMSLTHMRLCVEHYRNVLRRNPAIDELYFLDELVSTYGIRADNLVLTALEASSQYVFNTFKDFEERYARLCKSRNGLISFNDIMSMGFKITDAIGKPHILEDNELLQYADDEQAVECGAYLEQKELSCGLKHCKSVQVKAYKERTNDLAILIYSDNEDKEKIYRIVSEYSRHGIIKAHRSMAREGVTHSLLNLFSKGVFVAFDAFPIGMFKEVDELCKVFNRTFYVVRISNKDLPFFKSECARLGVKCCLIGYGINEPYFKVGRRDHSVMFSMNCQLLRALDIPMTFSAKLNNTASLNTNAKAEVHNGDEIDCFTVNARGGDTFFDTLNALLGAIGTAISFGYELNAIEMSAVLRLPAFDRSKYNEGGYIGYALALYRVVSELGLNGNGECIIDPTLNDAVIEATVYAKANKRPEATPFKAATGNIYLLNPITVDGTVSFTQVKGVIEYLTRLIRSGAARYIRFIGGQTIWQLIDEIRSECSTLKVDPNLDLEFTLPFAFLVETDGKLNGKLLAYY